MMLYIILGALLVILSVLLFVSVRKKEDNDDLIGGQMILKSKKPHNFEQMDMNESQLLSDEVQHNQALSNPDTTKKAFVPIEDTQINTERNNPVQTITNLDEDIPDNIFAHKNFDFDGVTSIPTDLIKMDKIISCAIFDNHGLLLAKASNITTINLDKIAAWALQTAESARHLQRLTKINFWLSTFFSNYNCIIIKKNNTGCVILVDRTMEINNINSLAKNMLEQIEDYRPNTYN